MPGSAPWRGNDPTTRRTRWRHRTSPGRAIGRREGCRTWTVEKGRPLRAGSRSPIPTPVRAGRAYSRHGSTPSESTPVPRSGRGRDRSTRPATRRTSIRSPRCPRSTPGHGMYVDADGHHVATSPPAARQTPWSQESRLPASTIGRTRGLRWREPAMPCRRRTGVP